MKTMINNQVYFLFATLLAPVTAQVTCNLTPSYPGPILSNGWSAQLVAQGLNKPRSIIFDTNGNLLVVGQGEGIKHLSFNDGGSTCLQVSRKTDVIDNGSLNHGIAFSADGRTLYASSVNSVYSWSYDPATGTVSGTNRTIITGMQSGGHITRTLMMSKAEPGMLVVARGSDGNYDDAASVLDFGHSQLRAFNVSNLTATSSPYDYNTQGVRLGWGLRNSVGVAEEPSTGAIYSVENSADEMQRNGQDIHTNNPGEEMNFHGSLNDTTPRGNYGYPDCFALWNTSIPDLGSLKVGNQFALEQNATVNDTTCNNDRAAPRLTFQAHTAPLDIKFQPNGSEAYVSFHGSWDREDPVGYTISSIPFANGSPIAPSDTTNSSHVIISNPDNSRCPDNCFRPVGLALDGAGRLWFSSDSTGEIWVMAKTSKDTSSPHTTVTSGGTAPSSTSASASASATKTGKSDGGRLSPALVTLAVAGLALLFAMVI